MDTENPGTTNENQGLFDWHEGLMEYVYSSSSYLACFSEVLTMPFPYQTDVASAPHVFEDADAVQSISNLQKTKEVVGSNLTYPADNFLYLFGIICT